MITEDVLERGLAAAGEEYDVPEGGLDRVRGLLAPSVAEEDAEEPRRIGLHRPGRRGWIAIAAAGVALLIAIPLAGGGGIDTPRQQQRSPIAGAIQDRSSSEDSGGAYEKLAPNNGAPAWTGREWTSADGVGTGGNLDNGAYAPTLPDTPSGPRNPLPTSPDRVVKTGVLDLQAPKGKVGSMLDQIAAIATIERGYIESSRTSEGGGAPSGRVTMRVPVASFDDAVKRARALGTAPGAKVLGLETSGEDVTGRYVDLKARISALQKTRETFLTLLNKATTIGETLSVQQRVTDVQTEIERLQGQLKVLANRSAMSTLTVTVDQKLIIESTPGEKSGIHQAFDRSVDRFVNGVEAIVAGTGPVLLAIIVIAALWFGGRFGYRVLRRNMV